MTPASIGLNLEPSPCRAPGARPALPSRRVCAHVLRLQLRDQHHPQVRNPGAEVTRKQIRAFALERAPLPPGQGPAAGSAPTCPGDITITGCGWEHPIARRAFPGHPDRVLMWRTSPPAWPLLPGGGPGDMAGAQHPVPQLGHRRWKRASRVMAALWRRKWRAAAVGEEQLNPCVRKKIHVV